MPSTVSESPKHPATTDEGRQPQPSGSQGPELEKLNLQQVREVVLTRHFSGPLPPPEALERYEQVLPNAAERIFRLWEDEVEHRRNLEQTQAEDRRRLQEAQVRNRLRTQTYALILALSVLLATVFFISEGHDAAGTTVLLVEVVALAALFIGGRTGKLRNRKVDREPNGMVRFLQNGPTPERISKPQSNAQRIRALRRRTGFPGRCSPANWRVGDALGRRGPPPPPELRRAHRMWSRSV